MALTVVTGEGKVVHTARRAKKSSAGYDLTRLFVGSEGTLGVITESHAAHVSTAGSGFGCVVFISYRRRCGADNDRDDTNGNSDRALRIARRADGAKAVNARDKLGLPEMPLLLFEFHGSETSVAEQAAAVEEIAREHGAAAFDWATRPEDRTRLWEARHNAYFACLQLKPGCRSFTTDVCVPISRLAECIAETVRDTEQSFLPAPILGHVGDGNFHCAILADTSKPNELAEAPSG